MTPIHIIVARMKRLPLPHRIAHLRALVAAELPHSVRRNELESLLRGAMESQILKEIREDRKSA